MALLFVTLGIAMSPSFHRDGVVADVGPGMKSLRGRPVTGHSQSRFSGTGWTCFSSSHRGGPGSTPAPGPDGQIPGKTPRRGRAIHESRPIRRTAANPASQPQASHHEHLQAIQSGVFCGPQLVGVRRGVSVRQIHNRWPTTWSSFDTCRRSRAGRWEWSPCLTASPDTRSSWS